MALQCRHEQPDTYYLLTNRTENGEFLFRPDDECQRICKGVLARAADKHDIDLVSYIFPSNHFHLVARFPDQNRGPFMRDFQTQLSKRIKKHRGRQNDDSSVFPKPYDAEALLDPESLIEAISYTTNNAVRHGLVTHPENWPGAGASKNLKTGAPLKGEWLDHNEWYNLSRRQEPPSRDNAMIEYSVGLVIPDELPGETRGERRQNLAERLESDRKQFCAEQGLNRHLRRRQPSTYKSESWQTRRPATEESESPRRACWASDPATMAQYLEWRREIDQKYRRAADRWKRGKPAVFPLGTYPPGRARSVQNCVARAPPEQSVSSD